MPTTTIERFRYHGYEYVCEEETYIDPNDGCQYWHMMRVPGDNEFHLIDFGPYEKLMVMDVVKIVWYHLRHQALPRREDFNKISPLTADDLVGIKPICPADTISITIMNQP